MSISTATQLTVRLLCLAMFLQALEIFWLARRSSILRIWRFQDLQPDLKKGFAIPGAIVTVLFSDPSLVLLAGAQCLFAIGGFFGVGGPLAPVVFLLLLVTHLMICIRFRGAINGGSDMMTVVVVTGSLVATAFSDEKLQSLGLVYIAIHAGYSYFRAGLAKIARPEWRDGSALGDFLNQSLYPDVHSVASWLKSHRRIAAGLSWMVLIFELSAPAIPFVPGWAQSYFLLALGFHFVVFLTFGLNRFFWIWLSAWPAILFASKLMTG